jgi:hypothetical protein
MRDMKEGKEEGRKEEYQGGSKRRRKEEGREDGRNKGWKEGTYCIGTAVVPATPPTPLHTSARLKAPICIAPPD